MFLLYIVGVYIIKDFYLILYVYMLSKIIKSSKNLLLGWTLEFIRNIKALKTLNAVNQTSFNWLKVNHLRKIATDLLDT